jgi:hypothetical protein
MTEMENRGWLRMIVRDSEVLIDAYKASSVQLQEVKNWTIERHKILYDEKTQKQFVD